MCNREFLFTGLPNYPPAVSDNIFIVVHIGANHIANARAERDAVSGYHALRNLGIGVNRMCNRTSSPKASVGTAASKITLASVGTLGVDMARASVGTACASTSSPKASVGTAASKITLASVGTLGVDMARASSAQHALQHLHQKHR